MDEQIIRHFSRLLKTQVRKRKVEQRKAYYNAQGIDLWKLDTKTGRHSEPIPSLQVKQQGEEQRNAEEAGELDKGPEEEQSKAEEKQEQR